MIREQSGNGCSPEPRCLSSLKNTGWMMTILLFELPACKECQRLHREITRVLDRLPDHDIQLETRNLMLSIEARQYNVTTAPCLVVLKNGTEVGRFTQISSAEVFIDLCM